MGKKAEREISAGGVVFRRENKKVKYLLIKDSYGRWSFPKGNIEPSESVKEAALREISEETGLKKIKYKDRIDTIKYFYTLDGKFIFKIVIFVLVEVKDSKLFPQKEEISEAKWFTKEEVKKRLNYKNTIPVFLKAVELVESKK